MEKIGRNDPCPCGSGKKFKKCHMGSEDDIFAGGSDELSFDMSARITSLPAVEYGRSREILAQLDIKKLTGSDLGVKFIDLKAYSDLDMFGRRHSEDLAGHSGGVFVNVLKTRKSDPDNLYIGISPKVEDSTLVHQLAHALDYLAGSHLIPGLSKPLGFDLGIPVEHLEHPREFGYWLDYLRKEFQVELDADDCIVAYLFENDLLIEGRHIEGQDRLALKSKSDRILAFMSRKSAEIDALICERKGYIGSRVKKDN